jgi:menaquinone-dependent protoporphyrinogen oxidase
MRTLIVFGTSYGQTAKIANAMGRTLRAFGDTVRVVDGGSVPPDLAVDQFDAVIIGASVHGGHFQPSIGDFITRHHAQLQCATSAFFGVSLIEADPNPRERAKGRQLIQGFLTEHDWQPDQIASFAGAIAYPRGRWLTRLMLRRFPPAEQVGAGSVREYTDWDAVTRFVAEFAAEARALHPADAAA